MSEEVLVKVENVSKRFCRNLKRSLWYGLQDLGSQLGRVGYLPQTSSDIDLRKDEFWAVKDMSFELRRGECLGLIGRNGAGKTTLLRMLNGLIKPDTGKITTVGNTGALIALGSGFNPILSGRENIYISASILGISESDIDRKLEDIIEFAELRDFIDSPVQTYSSGMQVRLGFAAATSFKPDILILDEVLAVGDIAFKAKCYSRLGEILHDTAVILVTHNETQISRLSTTCVLLEKGILIMKGKPQDVISFYLENTNDPKPQKTNVNRLHSSLKILVESASTKYGGNIRFSIRSEKSLNNLSLVVQLSRNHEVVASSIPIAFPVSTKKYNCYYYDLSLGPLYLAAGSYSLNLFIESSSRQQLLFHATSIDQVDISGFAQATPASLITLRCN